MTEPGRDPINLDREEAESLVKLLRAFEKFLDDCEESIADAVADHFGLSPAAEAFSAALSIHADALEAALCTTDFTPSRTPT
ncbi:hypothetical protein ACIQVL_22750 [Streptomyces sp. NPDC090499]|uniref:hypothetical protein n=1 Tax=Streptomyces sp. NPDC090499 TaxID=3365965 RepID=UPI00381F39CF